MIYRPGRPPTPGIERILTSRIRVSLWQSNLPSTPSRRSVTTPENAATEEYVDLRQYISILRYRKWSVILVAFLVLAGALAFSLRQTPLYRSEAEVLVKAPSTPGVLLSQQPNLDTERQIALSETVAERVSSEHGSDPETLLRGLSVRVEANTEILAFSYMDPSPARAQQLTQAFANSYLQYRRQESLDDLLGASDTVQQRIEEVDDELRDVNKQIRNAQDEAEIASLESQARALEGQLAILQREVADLTPPDTLRVGQVVGPANLPRRPASPNYIRNALLGLIVGMALGIGLAFLRERLDDRLRGRDDLEVVARAPVLAAVPRVSGWRRKAEPVVVTISESKSAAAEAYRTLRTSVLFAMGQSDTKVLMITSPHAGDGKTTTVANLAVVLAQAGKRVIAVSADLRKPRIHHYFGLESLTGLTNVLAGEISPWQALKSTEIENLQVLPSGPIPGNPAELLGSDAMGTLLANLAETADVVLVDAAPALVVSDALAMVALTDGVLMVADAEATHRTAVQQARRQLDQVDARVLGAVLNNFDPGRAAAYSYYYGYYYYGGYNDQQPPKTGTGNDGGERSRLFRKSAER